MAAGPTRLEVLAPAPSRSRPVLILAPVVFVLGLATAAVSLWLNASFLWAFGRTSDASLTLAVIGGITDIATLVLPPTLVGLWARRRFVVMATALSVYLLAVVMTALASLCFASTHIGDAVGGPRRQHRAARRAPRGARPPQGRARRPRRLHADERAGGNHGRIARNQECGRVGSNCRARVAELNGVLRDRALTEGAAELDAEIATLTGKIERTPALKNADPQVASTVHHVELHAHRLCA